jgi:hypothetical protein
MHVLYPIVARFSLVAQSDGRNPRMEAARVRKEQLSGADERRALIAQQTEERARKEDKVIAGLRGLVHDRAFRDRP